METLLLIIVAVLLVIGLGLIGMAFFKWLFYFKPSHKSEEFHLEKECCQKIHQMVSDMKLKLVDLQKGYSNNQLLDKWEKKVEEIEKEYTTDIQDFELEEMQESVSDMQNIIETGTKRIQQGKNPFDKLVLREDECEPQRNDSSKFSVLDIIVCGSIFLICGGFAYTSLFAVGLGPFMLTIAFAGILFPDGLPQIKNSVVRVVDKKGNFKYFVYFFMISWGGWYLNKYIYAQSDLIKLIAFFALPVIYGIIYWKIGSKRKVKEL